ncbi:hypothetical protein V6W11_19825 [Micromonospora profundi]|uniref:hypothetical protein n=1 Tax=Micromonospora profundi TaxID=1420889 RepID=UPI002FF3A8DA
MHPVLSEYVKRAGFDEARSRRMVNGLRVLQEIAAKGDQPITYAVFAEKLQPGLAPLATGAILEDIGVFCNQAGWPNVTCFVVSATTGECSDGFTKISSESPMVARDAAWFAYAVYKSAPRVDDEV